MTDLRNVSALVCVGSITPLHKTYVLAKVHVYFPDSCFINRETQNIYYCNIGWCVTTADPQPAGRLLPPGDARYTKHLPLRRKTRIPYKTIGDPDTNANNRSTTTTRTSRMFTSKLLLSEALGFHSKKTACSPTRMVWVTLHTWYEVCELHNQPNLEIAYAKSKHTHNFACSYEYINCSKHISRETVARSPCGRTYAKHLVCLSPSAIVFFLLLLRYDGTTIHARQSHKQNIRCTHHMIVQPQERSNAHIPTHPPTKQNRQTQNTHIILLWYLGWNCQKRIQNCFPCIER